MDAVVAVLLVQVHEDLGVRARLEAVAEVFQAPAQRLVVVDLAVEDGHERAVLVGDRLMAALDVDDAQAAHAQPHVVVEVKALVVRASVAQHLGHAPHDALVGPAHHAADAAHLRGPAVQMTGF